MEIRLVPVPSATMPHGYVVGVTVRHGGTVRKTVWKSWETAIKWIGNNSEKTAGKIRIPAMVNDK